MIVGQDPDLARQRKTILTKIKAIETEAPCTNSDSAKKVPIHVLKPLFANTTTFLEATTDTLSPAELTRLIQEALQGIQNPNNNFNNPINSPPSL